MIKLAICVLLSIFTTLIGKAETVITNYKENAEWLELQTLIKDYNYNSIIKKIIQY